MHTFLLRFELYLNLSEMDDEDFAVSAADKALNEQFYGKLQLGISS